MSKKIVVDGMSFVQSGRPYYYCSSKRLYLHRYLWEKQNGKIPEGYEIHHKDLDANNNDLNNLQLISKEEHRKLHSMAITEERRNFMRNNLNEKARPKAIEWHGSEKGKEWHKEHYEKMKDKLHAKKDIKCDCCGNIFFGLANNANRFCSNKCKSKWRRDRGLDNVKKNCIYCGSEYESNKYRKTMFCSRKCSGRSRSTKDSPT